MEIRPALPTEAGTVASLWLRSRKASVPSIPPPVHSDGEVHRWFGEIMVSSQEVWVADRHGQVVALMVLAGKWIDQLYVEPASTAEGIGSDLVAYAKGLRPAGLKLWTFQGNLAARRFYEAHGFVATVSTAGDNEERAPDVCYDWCPSGTPGSVEVRGSGAALELGGDRVGLIGEGDSRWTAVRFHSSGDS